MNEAFLIDHVDEGLRYDLGKLLQVDTLGMHLFDLGDWNAFLEAHGQDSFLCVVSIDLWNIDSRVMVLEHLSALVCIVSLLNEIKLLWKTSLELMR